MNRAPTRSCSVKNKELFAAFLPPQSSAGRAEFALEPQNFCVCACFRRHASVRFPPRVRFDPNSHFCVPFFPPCPPHPTHPAGQTTPFCPGIALVSGRSPPAEAACSDGASAGPDGHCEVSVRSHSSLLCAPTFTLQQLLRSALLWKFWDI